MRTEQKEYIVLNVNGTDRKFTVGSDRADVAPSETLAKTLRDKLDLTSVKISCDKGACGCCTVIADKEAVLACSTLTVECDGKSIITLEGLEDPATGELDPIQQAFIDHTAFQCGFCTPGVIMTIKALLMKNPHPSEDELKEALAGNYCRCGSHHQVVETVMDLTREEA